MNLVFSDFFGTENQSPTFIIAKVLGRPALRATAMDE